MHFCQATYGPPRIPAALVDAKKEYTRPQVLKVW
jgi:hypothetical protein